jgi:hypothetical protein
LANTATAPTTERGLLRTARQPTDGLEPPEGALVGLRRLAAAGGEGLYQAL